MHFPFDFGLCRGDLACCRHHAGAVFGVLVDAEAGALPLDVAGSVLVGPLRGAAWLREDGGYARRLRADEEPVVAVTDAGNADTRMYAIGRGHGERPLWFPAPSCVLGTSALAGERGSLVSTKIDASVNSERPLHESAAELVCLRKANRPAGQQNCRADRFGMLSVSVTTLLRLPVRLPARRHGRAVLEIPVEELLRPPPRVTQDVRAAEEVNLAGVHAHLERLAQLEQHVP